MDNIGRRANFGQYVIDKVGRLNVGECEHDYEICFPIRHMKDGHEIPIEDDYMNNVVIPNLVEMLGYDVDKIKYYPKAREDSRGFYGELIIHSPMYDSEITAVNDYLQREPNRVLYYRIKGDCL